MYLQNGGAFIVSWMFTARTPTNIALGTYDSVLKGAIMGLVQPNKL